jgi:predicted nucleic acid-binding protein
MIVVSDTSPINYLILIGAEHLLHRLFGRVIIPEAVHRELVDLGAPESVRAWALALPPWVEVRQVELPYAPLGLDIGETEAICLAGTLNAGLLLMDDRKAVDAARARSLTVVGTLGLLVKGAQFGVVDATALDRLRATNFRASARLLQTMRDRLGNSPESQQQ